MTGKRSLELTYDSMVPDQCMEIRYGSAKFPAVMSLKDTVGYQSTITGALMSQSLGTHYVSGPPIQSAVLDSNTEHFQ